EGYVEKHEEARRKWGGGIMGAKSQNKTLKKIKARESALKI
ncbi:unnamed protein product, partial [Parascedosporium putredinis]